MLKTKPIRVGVKEKARNERREAARRAASANRTLRTRTSHSYLRTIIDEIDMNDCRAVARKVLDQAIDGDPKARDWIGKYVLGNGKVSLADLSCPSILARKI